MARPANPIWKLSTCEETPHQQESLGRRWALFIIVVRKTFDKKWSNQWNNWQCYELTKWLSAVLSMALHPDYLRLEVGTPRQVWISRTLCGLTTVMCRLRECPRSSISRSPSWRNLPSSSSQSLTPSPGGAPWTEASPATCLRGENRAGSSSWF